LRHFVDSQECLVGIERDDILNGMQTGKDADRCARVLIVFTNIVHKIGVCRILGATAWLVKGVDRKFAAKGGRIDGCKKGRSTSLTFDNRRYWRKSLSPTNGMPQTVH